jgi:hypothetical protein
MRTSLNEAEAPPHFEMPGKKNPATAIESKKTAHANSMVEEGAFAHFRRNFGQPRQQ